MNKISVVIATYNGELFIAEQLRSILDQSVIPDEIIICDDSSTDRTISEILNVFAHETVKFKIIRHSKNQGVIESFREGISQSTGNVIFFSDQDDYWLKDKIEKFQKIFDSNPEVGLVFSDAYITNKELKPKNITLWKSINFHYNSTYNQTKLVQEMLKRNIFTGMCMAFRKEILSDEIWFSDKMLHDECLGWFALCKSRVYAINEPLVYYRQHENNIKGVMKLHKPENINMILECILRSTDRYIGKFEDIRKYVDEYDKMTKDLENVISFYAWRKMIFKNNRLKSVADIIKRLVRSEYQKYGSSTDYNLMKDIFLIVFKRRVLKISNQCKVFR